MFVKASKNGARRDQARRWEKRCTGTDSCGLVKTVDVDDRKRSDFYIMKASAVNGKRGGHGLRPDNLCKLCRCAKTRAHRLAAGEEGRQRQREARLRWEARQGAEKIAQGKVDSRLRARERDMVPVQPFAEWLIEFRKNHADQLDWVMRKPRQPPQLVSRFRASVIADVAKLDVKVIEDLLVGRRWSTKIRIDRVDRVLTYCGSSYMMPILYPIEEESSAPDSS